MQVQLSQSIWHVRVFTDDELRVEDYWFRHKADVLTSIRTTWSKQPDDIEVTDDGNQIEVRSTKIDPEQRGDLGKLLVACHMRESIRVYDGPTHL